MRNLLFIVAMAGLLLAPRVEARAGEVIDRTLAVVDAHVITQSEVEEQAQYEFLLDGRPVQKITREDREKSLARLIDQRLIRRQMELEKFVSAATKQEIADRTKEVRAQLPGMSSDDNWRAAVKQHGLTEEEVATKVAEQLELLRYLDLRFRPRVRVDSASIQHYYREKLLPEMERKGAQAPGFDKVSVKIEKLLAEQQMDELLAEWLRGLRSLSRVEKISESQ